MSVCGKLSNEKGSAYIEVNWIVRVIGCILLKSDTELCNGRCSKEGSFCVLREDAVQNNLLTRIFSFS